MYKIAQMFGGKIEMLPERQGSRMIAEVKSDKNEGVRLGAEVEHSGLY